MKYAVLIVEDKHSEVFREVAEAVHYGLLELGHESVIVPRKERFSFEEHVPIVLGWNLLSPSAVLPARSILYNLEQAGSRWLHPERLAPFVDYQFWDWKSPSLDELKSHGIRAELVPLGYVPEWTRIAPAKEKDIDVLFYGSTNDRRHEVLRKMSERLKVAYMYNAYGEVRDAHIARARVVLNLHYDAGNTFEIARVGYLLANRALVLSESSEDSEGFEGAVQFERYENLADRAFEMVHWSTAQREIATELGFEAIRSRPMADYLKKVL